ncbi:major facilitator superfamily transport protein (probable substrate nitrate/nitrite) [Halobacterium hubeiense]|jgi:NNP family nitrate/nitrite transporter-like MFS transporter|uniref:MFS transporter n=2 Tax=Halobacterium TaxID=2239 RepID=A0AAU8CBL7_9EURY|nr:MFS transporter [Halobacterium hubeiense]CQH54385.1 major facilitator superfamily transport protein (probable substrate nitrate/nitrite) [Halobacterium hubeiense]
MALIRMTKYRTLLLATVGFNFSFLIWFSFAPFTEPMASEFGLSLAEIGLLASANIWLAPFGRALTGWLSDKFGAPSVFAIVLGYVGVFSIASAFAQSYGVFFVERLIVATAGITFVVGIQHVAEWFEEENLGLAEGIYAGIGNAGAAGGALILPRVFGTNWNGPLFSTNWRAAFFYTGVVSILLGVAYFTLGEAAKTEEKRQATKDSASFGGWVHTATRYGTLVLALAYVMTFGLELSMNGWLATYYREGFGTNNLVLASTFAATFSVAAGLLRPIGGYVSDRLARAERNILPFFTGHYREQWTFTAMSFVVVAMFGMTLAGLSGEVLLAVAAGFLVGMGCAFAEGAIFAQVPAMFPNSSGAVAGVVGGVGTIGGIVYPLVYSAQFLPNLHVGYAVVAASMVPILALTAWVFQPRIASVAHEAGFGSSTPSAVEAPGDD